jgi:hypothetical protein
MHYIVVELVLVLLVVNYIMDLILCVIFVLYSLSDLKAPRPGRQSKHTIVKKIKLLYSSVYGSAAGYLRGPIYSSVNR